MKKKQKQKNSTKLKSNEYKYSYKKTNTNIIVAFLSKGFESQKRLNIVFSFVLPYIIIYQ